MNTSEYENYLCKKIQEAVKFAGNDELFIYLSPEDASYQHSLVARTGFRVRVSDEPFMGGIKATIPSKNILIDNSFMEAYQSLKKEFKNEEDFDTFVAKYRGYMRYSFGFSDWRGMVGSTGGEEIS